MDIYHRILAVYAKLRAAINNKSDRNDIASEFRTNMNYSKGMLVIYNDRLYICTAAHIGAWDESHFATATVENALEAKVSNDDLPRLAMKLELAGNFSTSTSYDVGRLVIYGNALYMCRTAHPAGAWNGSHFKVATVDDALRTKPTQADLVSKASKSDVANNFYTQRTYNVGDLVIYNNEIYRCIAPHLAGGWDASHFRRATIDDAMTADRSVKADKASVAAEFDSSISYDVGRLVLYYGKIYRCTTAHTGTWNSGHFAVATVDDVLKTKITASDVADNASRSDIAPEFSTTTEYIAGELVYKEGVLYKCIKRHEAGSWDAGDFSAADVNDALMYDSRAGVVDTTLYPGANYVELSSGTITQIDASQLTSLTVTPAIPPPVEANGRFKMTDMLLRVDTGSSACTITHGWAGPCIYSNPDWNILPANAINILTYTYVGEVSQSNPDPVFLVGVVSRPIDQGSPS